MQSSTMVAVRTLVMVTCLVAVPLAAVVGTAVPKVLKSAWQRQAASLSPDSDAPEASDEADLQPPLIHSPLLADETSETSSAISADERPSAAPPPPAVPVARITAIRPVAAAPLATVTNVRPALGGGLAETAPLWSAAPRTAHSSATRQTTAHSLSARPLITTDYSAPPPGSLRSPAADETVAPLASLERPAGPNDSFGHSERRLRELGATHYRLENWGSRGDLYRCTCNIPLRPRSPAARHFESVESAPSEAIDAVIRQVERWRAGQRR